MANFYVAIASALSQRRFRGELRLVQSEAQRALNLALFQQNQTSGCHTVFGSISIVPGLLLLVAIPMGFDLLLLDLLLLALEAPQTQTTNKVLLLSCYLFRW
jgi:hypothetical protein